MSRPAVISLGAGVQSTTLLRMADAGEFDRTPDLAIFADTGAEPKAVYEHLELLEREVDIPIVRIMHSNLGQDARAGKNSTGNDFVGIPFHTRNQQGRPMLGRRQCTREYKIAPVRRELRKRGYTSVEMWLGISFDEVQRMKPADVKWVEHRWPLIDRHMSRSDCKRWLAEHGHPEPPRSACTFCPLHNRDDWRRLRDEAPEDFADAVDFERTIRNHPRFGDVFLHGSLVPLDQVDLTTEEDRGQLNFDAECEGFCGV